MTSTTASLTDWLSTPPGQYLLAWEDAQFERVVSDVFGYHALQLGMPALDTLRGNRMPHRWLAVDAWAAPTAPSVWSGAVGSSGPTAPTAATASAPAKAAAATTQQDPAVADAAALRQPALITEFSALPFAQHSLDLVAMPHTLERSQDPHATLREVARVLVPEGRVVISGLNPNSLWGLRQSREQMYQRLRGATGPRGFLPGGEELIGYWRLRDWLRLLDFEVESARFGGYVPSFTTQKWLDRFGWMDAVGQRWWPIFGAIYCVVAVKRVRGMRLLGLARRSSHARQAAPAVAANRLGLDLSPNGTEAQLAPHRTTLAAVVTARAPVIGRAMTAAMASQTETVETLE